MTQNGPKMAQMTLDDPKWPQMIENGPKMTQNCPKMAQMTQNFPIWPK